MKINVSKNLKELSDIFSANGHPLYIVGGYVRNALLGFCETDIDLCGTATPQEVALFVPANLYTVEMVNKKLGTLHLHSKLNSEVYEYTTFRAENYPKNGEHSPQSVEFVLDIRQDAKRRDFSANSIYYDIKNDQILDFYDGVKDTRAHILRTVETPEFVFSSDGLRMLRLVRIASELGFKIDKKCFLVAKSMIANLQTISRERFNKEIVSILYADYKYPSVNAVDGHICGLKNLTDLQAWQYVFKQLYTTNNLLCEVPKGKWFSLVAKAPASYRLSCFAIDFLNAVGLKIDQPNIALVLGEFGLGINKKEVCRQTQIILGFLDVCGGFANVDQQRLFVQHHIDHIDEIVGIAELNNGASDLKMLKNIMLIDKVPLKLKDLKINGDVLMQKFPDLPKTKYSEILNHLLTVCCIAPELNNKNSLVQIVKKYTKQ